MKLLEAELDCTLFERGSRTIRLTEAGETLYNYSRSLLQLSNVAKQETMNAARHFNGVLRIGIVSSLIGSDALGWLCGFSKQYPGIHYEINEADTYHLLSQFETNAIHLALLRTPFHTDSLTCKKLFTDSLVAVGQESFLPTTVLLPLRLMILRSSRLSYTAAGNTFCGKNLRTRT